MNQESNKSNSAFRDPHSALWRPYCQMKTAGAPVEVVATESITLHLKDGRTLIDGISSWWTACHGYRHPKIVEAIVDQAKVMPHVMMGGVVHQQAIRLAERLAKWMGNSGKVFLSDSGSVAVEVAMKMAVQHWANQSTSGKTTRNKFVSFRNAYHGDTTGAMSICDPVDSMHANFKGFLLEQFPHSIPDSDLLEGTFDDFVKKRKEQLAAVIVEPLVQMAAGMRFHSPEALARIANVCRKHDVLLIVDEVATGFGRAGTMFAHYQADTVHPDIMCVGKGLTGCSVGLAATIATDKVYAPFHSDRWESALMHGPTFMGNPIACAAANASLDLFQGEPRLEQVQTIEATMRSKLEPLAAYENVDAVNCLGAIGAVRMKDEIDVQKAVSWFIDKGVWIRPIRDTVYLAPAFTIDDSQLERLCDAIITWVAGQGQ